MESFVIVAHIYATGPALELEEYLNSQKKDLMFIGHPFAYTKDTHSFFRIRSNGEVVKKGKSTAIKPPSVLLYIKEFILTSYWIIKQKRKFDVYIGSDNYSAFIGLILQKFRLVDKVIFYTIDFVPDRFGNPILNYIYRFFDKQCLKYCHVVWNVSDAIKKARGSGKTVKQITVPLGMWYDRIPRKPFEKRKKNSIVFMGHVLEKQGLEVVIKSLPKIIKLIPTASLTIIGSGPYLDELKNLVKKLQLLKVVKFEGYIENHRDVEKMLSNCSLSVATYKPDPKSFTYFADPGKIKNYLGAGLPVVLTDVPPIAEVLEKEQCGLIAKYDNDDVAKKILMLLKNNTKHRKYSQNAKEFARQFDWNIIFDKAISRSDL